MLKDNPDCKYYFYILLYQGKQRNILENKAKTKFLLFSRFISYNISLLFIYK